MSEGRRERCLSSSREREFSLPLLSCFIWALNGWIMPTDIGEPAALLSSPTEMLISCVNSLTDTLRNHISKLSRHPLGQSS